jgi:hypothetical protein
MDFEEISKMKPYFFLVSLIMLCSCSYGDRNYFDNFEEFSKWNSKYGWVPPVVPEKASEIDVWYEIDTNSVRVSFNYMGNNRQFPGYQKIDENMKSAATKNYPAIESNNNFLVIWYRCNKFDLPDSRNQVGEVWFVGDTGTKVFSWNDRAPENYLKICRATIESVPTSV